MMGKELQKKELLFLKNIFSTDFGKNLKGTNLRVRAPVVATRAFLLSVWYDTYFSEVNLVNSNFKFTFIIKTFSQHFSYGGAVAAPSFYKKIVDVDLRLVDLLPYQKLNFYLHYIKNYSLDDLAMKKERRLAAQEVRPISRSFGEVSYLSPVSKEINSFYSKRALSKKKNSNKMIFFRSRIVDDFKSWMKSKVRLVISRAARKRKKNWFFKKRKKKRKRAIHRINHAIAGSIRSKYYKVMLAARAVQFLRRAKKKKFKRVFNRRFRYCIA